MGPAVLFLIFNRPDTTARVFSSIRQARPRRLYIAADGPRNDRPGERELCEQAWQVSTAIDWPCEVRTLFRGENLGCRKAVSEGIDWFFEHESEGIILEDDCLPHPTFFFYCQQLLDRYRNFEKVMSISGSCFARRFFSRSSYSFTYYADMWGWATWRRAWKHYDPDMKGWPQDREKLYQCFSGHSESIEYWSYFFDHVIKGSIDTWDYQWIWTVIQEAGMCVTPHMNFINNIGIRPDATHTNDPSWHIQRRQLQGVGRLRHPRRLSRNKRLERDIAIARLGVPRRKFSDRLSGRLRQEILYQTTYSSEFRTSDES